VVDNYNTSDDSIVHIRNVDDSIEYHLLLVVAMDAPKIGVRIVTVNLSLLVPTYYEEVRIGHLQLVRKSTSIMERISHLILGYHCIYCCIKKHNELDLRNHWILCHRRFIDAGNQII
jgi:hypothetical protein